MRKLAALAYERKLDKVLEALEKGFKRWRKNKITAFELSEIIHKFHNGPARDLWGFLYCGACRVERQARNRQRRYFKEGNQPRNFREIKTRFS